jgi:hypothetical protein
MSGTTTMQWAGTEFSPVGRRPVVDPGAEDAILRRLLAAEPTAAAVLPRVDPGALAVYRDEAGDEFVVLPTAEGPSLVPYLSGAPLDPEEDPVSDGGFLSCEALQRQAARVPKRRPEDPTPEEMREGLLEAMARSGLIDQSLWQRVRGSADDAHHAVDSGTGGPSPPGGAGTGDPGSDGAAGPAATGGGPPSSDGSHKGIWDTVEEQIPTMAAEQFGASILGGLLSAEGLKPSDLLTGAGGLLGAIGSAVGMAHLQRLLMKGLDDESSTAEWALKTVGPRIVQNVPLGNPWLYLGMEDSPYESPALRVCDPDDKTNAILEGCCSVLIEGKPAARIGDKVDKAGVICIYGARGVRIGGLDAARVDKTLAGLGYGTHSQAKGSFLEGAARTLIGGPTDRPASDPPPIPKQWSEDQTGIPHDQKFPFEPNKTGPGNPPRTESGYSFDELKGEWIMWNKDHGWSSTLLEHARVGFRPGWTLWDPEKDPGVWVLGTPLGSPEWPGAGTSSTWWVPDRLWGLDMGTYWRLHDWLFGPGHPNVALDPGRVLQVEWEAFTAGMSWNPLRWIPQLVYSGATTITALVTWWDNFAQELDHLAGFPDTYEYRDRLRPKADAGKNGR